MGKGSESQVNAYIDELSYKNLRLTDIYNRMIYFLTIANNRKTISL